MHQKKKKTKKLHNTLLIMSKKLIEKSRECHSHKPQPTPDTKRKKKDRN